MSEKPPRICLTGGGTAGHVMPHFALLPDLQGAGAEIFYIGSAGIEKDLVLRQGLRFYTIAAGKLRRYFSLRNLLDVFKVGLGVLQALLILLVRRPAVVFSKGGFVAVPVAVAAWLLRIPVVTHESDLTPGLATRLIKRVARRVLYTFPETGKFLGSSAVQAGTPVRRELFEGSRARGLELCGFESSDGRPVLLVMGGSQGAQRLNEILREALPEILKTYRVIHLTGKGKDIGFSGQGYKAFEFVGTELADLFAATDFVLCRAGANSIFEVLALNKPMLLVPLEQGSRGDQVLNSEAFVTQGWAAMARESELDTAKLVSALRQLWDHREVMIRHQASWQGRDAARKIIQEIFGAGGIRSHKP